MICNTGSANAIFIFWAKTIVLQLKRPNMQSILNKVVVFIMTIFDLAMIPADPGMIS
jgi:hypothetical protein